MARITAKWHILSAVTAALVLFFTPPALAKAKFPCAPRAEIVTVLLDKLKETPLALGKTLDGSVIEVFVSQARSWTILLTSASGMSCIAAAGENWTEAAGRPEAGI